jgi:hypothetical protein
MKTTPETGTEGIADGKNTVDGAARRLDMNIPVEAVMEDRLDSTNTISDGNQGMATPPAPPPYMDPRDRSKLRRTGDNSNTLASSAASVEEDRRAQ